ncbi:hypothetical protein HD806DRAFT_536087 [Xylariaceae sp. AK1471]|nr:hypothetical protein HD806DRAFT_536087 [Xylariaceae sp. AK1471]
MQQVTTSGSISPQKSSTQSTASGQPLQMTATSVSTTPAPKGGTQSSSYFRHDVAIGVGVGVASFVVLALVGSFLLWKKHTQAVATRPDIVSWHDVTPGSVEMPFILTHSLINSKATELIEEGYAEMSSSPTVLNMHEVTVSELPAPQSCYTPTHKTMQSASTCLDTCSAGFYRPTLAPAKGCCKHEEFVTSWNQP